MHVTGQTRASLRAWIAASHRVACKPLQSPNDGLPFWCSEFLSEYGNMPPIGIFSDFMALFTDCGTMEVPAPLASRTLRSAIRSYEDHVIGRLRSSPHFNPVKDAFASLSPPMRSRALVLLLQRFLDRISYTSGMSFSPGVLREVMKLTPSELLEEGMSALHSSTSLSTRLEESLKELTKKTRRVPALLQPADVFFVEHIGVLGSLSDRMLIQQVAEVRDRVLKALPKRVRSTREPLRAMVSTKLATEEEYPAGGFSSISTSGSLENLVISELIYMEDPKEGEEAVVDLFDLRYAEGELLYYTRDDAVFHRDHRTVQIVLQADLIEARQKDRGAQWQRLVIALGVVASLVEKLVELLGDQGLCIRLAFLRREGTHVLETEERIVSLLLHSWVEQGIVDIQVVDSFAEVVAELEDIVQETEVDLLGIGSDLYDWQELSPLFQVGQISLAREIPHLWWRHWPVQNNELEEKAVQWHNWQNLALEALSELV